MPAGTAPSAPGNDEVFARFWRRDLDIESVAALADILDRAGAPGFAAYAAGEGRADLRAVQDEAEGRGVFGVPSFLFEDGELFWGREHFARVRERLLA